jgi:hypothetical protein
MATKRALRALLKGNQSCVFEPERVARFLVDKGYTQECTYALRTIQKILAEGTGWRFLNELK